MTNKNNNLITKRKLANRGGFSLIEIISVTVISSMLLICAVGIFNRLQSATEAMNEKLDKQDIADEILQRIAEDLDRLAVPGFDTQLTVNNKTENGFNKTQLIIENKIYDKKNKPITFEKIVWQSEYDIMEEMPILYRYHGGLCLEDKILDGELQGEQADGTELYIPVAWGMTHFQIEIPKEDSEPLTQWSQKKLPTSVAIKISFAEATEDFEGTLEVAQEDMILRNIAIDRTRKQTFTFEKKEFTRSDEDDDPNHVGMGDEIGNDSTEDTSEEDPNDSDDSTPEIND